MSTNLNTKFINRFTPNTNKEHFYNIINEELKDYNADNMWSFSKNTQTKELNDEYISQHNEYIGLGSGGFSYLKGNLFVNAYDLKKYEELIKTKKDSVYAKSQFKQKDIAKYYVLCTIFSGELKIKDYNQRFDIPLEKYLKKELFILKLLKIIYIKNDIIYVTKKGRHLLTIMMSGFYSQMDKVRALFKNQGHLFE
ncbi:MAG: hypothetical protein CSA86_05270 [Arcobacter sp.]|nr:MAG: hypothetical protein CSA86_05270 [Arcobacter sp.]